MNADAVYRWHLPFFADAVNVGFGAEYRDETYQLKAGDLASYQVGPGAALGLAPASNGFPGIADTQAGLWSQNSYAGYLDLQAPLTEAWQFEVALRDENYSDFGNTFNYKLGTRYEFSPNIALRGSYSTGFKAPTPGQVNATSTSQGLDTVTLQVFTNGRLSPLNPVAQFFGAKPLQPEESQTATIGGVWQTESGFSGSDRRLQDRRHQAVLKLGDLYRHPGAPQPAGRVERAGRPRPSPRSISIPTTSTP